jgi:putative membrane protein insertion efficiency factor
MKQLREVRLRDLITFLPLSTVILAALWIVFGIFSSAMLKFWYVFYPVLLISVTITYYLLKRIAIGAVLMYKAFAPLETRDRCRFTPTCSTYMIMAINKYGLFIGVYKGIKRITRCRFPNGGVDFP